MREGKRPEGKIARQSAPVLLQENSSHELGPTTFLRYAVQELGRRFHHENFHLRDAAMTDADAIAQIYEYYVHLLFHFRGGAARRKKSALG
jgi:hypothetical protein